MNTINPVTGLRSGSDYKLRSIINIRMLLIYTSVLVIYGCNGVSSDLTKSFDSVNNSIEKSNRFSNDSLMYLHSEIDSNKSNNPELSKKADSVFNIVLSAHDWPVTKNTTGYLKERFTSDGHTPILPYSHTPILPYFSHLLPLCFHKHGEPADADQLFIFIEHFYIPDMGRSAEVKGNGGARNDSVPNASDVIGIDFNAHANILFRVNDHNGGYASQGFCECGRCAAMQDSIGLVCAFVYRHRTPEKIFTHFRDSDSK
jgi:hypothetical protein